MTADPRVSFVIGGVQKGGTTALAAFLARNPALALPERKEAHVFDAPGFDESWDVEQINRRYERHYRSASGPELHGDATPIYMFHPRLVARIARYNPAMRWIVVLRHPVERALSHHAMERGRGEDRWPFWLAMLLEKWRLRGHGDDLAAGSPLRRFSYRARGDYARQLDALYRHFPPEQVLVLFNNDLADSPDQTLKRVFSFLGVPDLSPGSAGFGRVFQGEYRRLKPGGFRWRVLCWIMRKELTAAKTRYGISWD